MSAIGELLREIMPAWLSPLPRESWSVRRAAMRQGRKLTGEGRRQLAREADAVWGQCVEEGRHGEAFPEDAPEKRWRRSEARVGSRPPAPPNWPH